MKHQNIGSPTPVPPAIAVPQPGGMDDGPQREIRFGLIIAAAFFILFLGWAAFARMDAAATGAGRVIVSGQRQTVQHRDGGVVGAIYVKEGQYVRRGAVLLRLSAAEVRAQERALASQVIALLAQRERLRAEQLGLPQIPRPPEFAGLAPEDLVEAVRAMRVQQLQFNARATLLKTQQGVLGRQSAQAGEEGEGYRKQLAGIREQERIIREQLDGMRAVAEKGFVSKNRIRDLERAEADLAGQRGRLEASISQSSESVGESRLRIVETERELQDKIASDLKDVTFSLGELMPKWQAARDQVARTEVRAPVSGAVVGLSVFTVGGVIAPGQKLMDIVPDRASLVIEARFSPNDIDDLQGGQEADIRFSGISDRQLPVLKGRVDRISADALVDEKNEQTYVTSEIVVPPDQIDLIKRERGADFSLKPGMPVEVLVPLHRRTALDYLLEPLTNSLWRSFREH